MNMIEVLVRGGRPPPQFEARHARKMDVEHDTGGTTDATAVKKIFG